MNKDKIKVPSNMKLMCYSSCDYDERATEMVFSKIICGPKNNQLPDFKSDFKALSGWDDEFEHNFTILE